MMQEKAGENSVPFPKRPVQSNFESLSKLGEVMELLGKIDEKMEETKNLGHGKPNSKHSYHVSEDIKLDNH